LNDENNDRADIQENSLRTHLEKQIKKLEQVRLKHILEGRMSLAKATEGRSDIIKINVERKLHSIELKRKLEASYEKVCIGIIDIV